MAVVLGIGTFAPIDGGDRRTIRQHIFVFVQLHGGFRRIVGTDDDFEQNFVVLTCDARKK